MPDHPLDLARLRALMEDANIVGTVCARDGSVLDEARRLIVFDSNHRDAAYLAALLNAAPALLEMAEIDDQRVRDADAARIAAIQRAEAAEARAQRLAQVLRDIRDAVEHPLTRNDIPAFVRLSLCQSIDAELAALATTTQEDK